MADDSPYYLVVMTKFPEPGKVKTRLAGELGEKGASDLHAALVDHLVKNTLSKLDEINVEFHVAGGSVEQVDQWLPEQKWKPQVGECLGEKMQNAIQSCFDQGAAKVAIMGTDAPAITPKLTRSLFESLDICDVAFTPALDGGYVMAAVKDVYKEMFEDITWSTETVLTESVTKLEQNGKSVFLQDPLSDVDTPADLQEVENTLGCKPWQICPSE